MKNILFKIVIFCKRPGFISRLIILGGSLILLFTMFIPDLRFNLEMKNPKNISIEQIQTMPKEDLPRYMVVENAQLMKVGSELSDSAMNTMFDGKIKLSDQLGIKMINYSYNYLIQQKVKKGDTSLSYIIYPVYSKSQVQKNPNAKASDLTSFVVIKDSHVTEKELEGDEYFNDSTFTVKGRFDGSLIDSESLRLLEENGYNISKDAIFLERGNAPMSLIQSIIFTILSAVIAALCFLSLLPISVLQRIFDIEL
jgi:hypothetical protein